MPASIPFPVTLWGGVQPGHAPFLAVPMHTLSLHTHTCTFIAEVAMTQAKITHWHISSRILVCESVSWFERLAEEEIDRDQGWGPISIHPDPTKI